MALATANGWNHVIGGAAAALTLPLAAFGLGIPFLPALAIAGGVYAGLAFALTPRRAIDRIDAGRVGRVQAELVAGLIEEGEAAVARLASASRGLRAGGAGKTAAHMAEVARGILDRLAADPDKLATVRRFLTYYLPRSAEIAEGLVLVEGQRVEDRKRLDDIAATLAKLDQAFTYYADNFAQTELDALDVELRLLSRSLAEDLGPAASDPARRKQKGTT